MTSIKTVIPMTDPYVHGRLMLTRLFFFLGFFVDGKCYHIYICICIPIGSVCMEYLPTKLGHKYGVSM